jgi:SAM-dependent methyltransferase
MPWDSAPPSFHGWRRQAGLAMSALSAQTHSRETSRCAPPSLAGKWQKSNEEPVEIRMPIDEPLVSDRFPRSSKYHPEWVMASMSGGANSLWLTEWLAETLELKPDMRVLDLGCGRAASSIFLRREFGVQVWATDLWFSASENFQRIQDAGVADGVFPIHAEARSLPFAADFFDAIVSIDSFSYYGTDDLYLSYLARFVKPGSPVGIAGAGLLLEIEGPVPIHLQEWWTPDLWCLHSPAWWRRHWERTGVVEIDVADTLPDGWQLWRAWHKAIAPDNLVEVATVEADRGSYLGYVRVVGRRTGVHLEEPILSMPAQYAKKPLLRTSE